MTTILERLEGLLDEVGNDSYEVDYHVSTPDHYASLL